jgi:hypothetical protein
VALQIGTFSTVIPAGRFQLERDRDSKHDAQGEGDEVNRYSFKGAINGVRLEFEIRASSNGNFKCRAEGRNANLMGTTEPVKVRLAIGDDGGTTTSEAKFDRRDDGTEIAQFETERQAVDYHDKLKKLSDPEED